MAANDNRTAVIAGVGPGLGESVARKFVAEGCNVALFARSEDYLEDLAEELRSNEGCAIAVSTDVRDEQEVRRGFRAVREEFGGTDVLVNHASTAAWKGLLDQSPEEFRDAWRTTAYGAFVCSQEAARDMLDAGSGTVIFTGATSAVRGRDGAVGFSSAKFAARGLAESLARELGPEGIHVAHVVIDGQINTQRVRETYADSDGSEDSFLDPDEIAETYWDLVQQDKSAWTLELDLRPYTEEF